MKAFWQISIFLFSLGIAAQAQDSCHVLVKGLQGSYTGGCKKGLANGKGEAKGVDSYSGYFKNGVPNGEGTYIWATGEKYVGTWYKGQKNGDGSLFCKIDGRDTVLAGMWNKDKYEGPKPLPPVVNNKYNIQNIFFNRNGDGSLIYIYITIAGGPNTTVSNLNIMTNSGIEFTSGSYHGFDKVSFPFICKISYSYKNAFMTGVNDCGAEFVIKQPGIWTVKIFN